jgi:AcrR family transcriptional regulator
MKRNRKAAVRDAEATRKALVEAARRAFNEDGFLGTDSNKIARAAGFAPQTFYRHFSDKTEIFLAVYEGWWTAEADALEDVKHGSPSSAEEAARIILQFHRRWRVFRRSLRHLSVVDPRVRAARANARKAQVVRARAATRTPRSDAEWIAILLSAERLCDAAADDELADLGIKKADIEAMVARVVAPLVGG